MKEQGYTSSDVVVKLRGMLHVKKIGHTGTLDPDATGVLPICIGKATKIASELTDTDKAYRCVMRLGVTTDTEDMTGEVLSTSDCEGITGTQVREAITYFIGEYDQIPPMYSAKKINGKKLYELAREGIEIERKPSRINIISISDINVDISGDIKRAEFSVECSKGTYIRSLCRDIGAKLGCGAAMESLVRIKACGIDIDKCLTLSEIEKIVPEGGDLGENIIPIDRFFMKYPPIRVMGRDEKLVRSGNKFRREGKVPGRYRVYLRDLTFAALYDVNKKGEARLCRLFLG